MQKTKEAIKYCLSTLKVTPKELFALIESSNGYTGEEYNRWLVSHLIKIAEKDGVGYSQLLAKWFNIISSIEEDSSDMSIKEEYVKRILGYAGDNVYTVGMGEDNDFGTELTDIDWFDGVDIPWNTWFTDEKLPEEVAEKLHSGEQVTLLINLDAKLSFKKNCSLFQYAKSNGVVCSNSGSLLMYRVCNILSAMEKVEGFRVIFVADTAFLLNKENSTIIHYLLNYFNYEGFVVNSKDLYKSAFTSEDYAVLVCSPIMSGEGVHQDGIVLPKVNGSEVELKRYSCGGNMWGKLLGYEGDGGYLLKDSGKAEMGMFLGSKIEGKAGALGYICKSDSSRVAELSVVPVNGTKYAPITVESLQDVIVYYGVTEALQSAGLSCNIQEVLSGHPEYNSLVANCVPVFLFGLNSNFRRIDGVAENEFDIENSELVAKLLDRSSQYYSYETKELVSVCKGFIDFIKSEGLYEDGKTFSELRALANNPDLNREYIDALNRCLGYICTQYRRM